MCPSSQSGGFTMAQARKRERCERRGARRARACGARASRKRRGRARRLRIIRAMGSRQACGAASSRPGPASANNGNWRTAARWAAMLRGRVPGHCTDATGTASRADALVALHARRSADSIARVPRSASRARRSRVVLTGTDLYRDLPAATRGARARSTRRPHRRAAGRRARAACQPRMRAQGRA